MQIGSAERIDDLHYEQSDDVEDKPYDSKEIIPIVDDETNKQELEDFSVEKETNNTEKIADYAGNDETQDYDDTCLENQVSNENLPKKKSEEPIQYYRIIKDPQDANIPIDDDDEFKKWYVLDGQENPNLGRMKVCCFINGKPLIAIGPDWPMYFVLNVLIQIFVLAYLYIFRNVMSDDLKRLTYTLDFIQIIVYLNVFLRNPGLASFSGLRSPDDLKFELKRMYYCMHCRLIRWDGVEHCFGCNVCILDAEHHCPWTGKCIGQGNKYSFKAFIYTSVGLFVYLIIVTLFHMVKARRHHDLQV